MQICVNVMQNDAAVGQDFADAIRAAIIQRAQRLLAVELTESTHAEIIIDIPITSPLFDEALTQEMLALAQYSGCQVTAQGAIPGTAPSAVYVPRAQGEKRVFSTQQAKHNAQFNLCRKNRLKVFMDIIKKYPEAPTWPMQQLLEFFASPAGVALVLQYGSDYPVHEFKQCPYCASERLSPLYSTDGQPIYGFLTRDSVYYNLCQDCEGVFLNPCLAPEHLSVYYDEFAYPQYTDKQALQSKYTHLSESNTSHLANYQAILPVLMQLPKQAQLLDIGGGLGEFCVFARHARDDVAIHLADFRINTLAQAILKDYAITCQSVDFVNEPDLWQNQYDLITLWEVIEHIHPTLLLPFLKNLGASLKPEGCFCLSTPDYASPIAQALDFWAFAPGEHVSVFSRKSLEPLLAQAGLIIESEHHESVTLKAPERWFAYAAEYHPNASTRGMAHIIENVLHDEMQRANLRDSLRRQNQGSELILCCRKQD